MGRFVQGSLKNLVRLSYKTIGNFGTDNSKVIDVDESQDTLKQLKTAKKDERLFMHHEKTFEKMHVELIQLSKLSKEDVFELDLTVGNFKYLLFKIYYLQFFLIKIFFVLYPFVIYSPPLI